MVLFAYKHGKPGEIFVQKAPTATIANITQAIKEIFNADNEIQVICTRHGEKLYETLLSREEIIKAEDTLLNMQKNIQGKPLFIA